jgi:microcystin-dependent protein
MAEPFLGEIRLFPFSFAPTGWALCDGQYLAITQNQALFSLLGTTYGGDSRTFALPNLQGRVPIHFGKGIVQGAQAGEEAHTLTVSEMPAHTHQASASASTPGQNSPGGGFWASQPANAYSAATDSFMAPQAIALAGGGKPHENRSPYLVLNFCIALSGIFPTRN